MKFNTFLDNKKTLDVIHDTSIREVILEHKTLSRMGRLDTKSLLSLTDTALEQNTDGFKTTSGKAMGLSLKVTAPGANAYISIGSSFLSGLSEYLGQILTPKGALTVKTDGLNTDLTDYNQELVDLDEEIEKTRQRYKEQYGEMEATVNTFKRTGEYLTNYMEAQNSDN